MSDSGQSMRLLQALNDENQNLIVRYLKKPSVIQSINDNVRVESITKPRIRFPDGFSSITCLCYASQYNTIGIVRQLVQVGADVTVTDSWNNTPLHHACRSLVDAKEKVEFLLSFEPSLVKARNKFID